jgi:hypothetical protein
MSTHRAEGPSVAWERNLEVLAPPGTSRVSAGGSRLRGAAVRRVRALPPGSAVLVWGPARSCRRLARSAGIEVDREFIAIPSVRSPIYLVEKAPEPINYFCSTLLTLPPGASLLAPLGEAVLTFIRAVRRSPWIGSVLPGRVLVGRRR